MLCAKQAHWRLLAATLPNGGSQRAEGRVGEYACPSLAATSVCALPECHRRALSGASAVRHVLSGGVYTIRSACLDDRQRDGLHIRDGPPSPKLPLRRSVGTYQDTIYLLYLTDTRTAVLVSEDG